ncbi:hypothetical protein LX69_00284 [Breznakibacter xylanolyticus]|uniref:Uncharacterized protein n=1 Tax=Breznakibacter xylanolyticus TaxID=990 RepID=A0A2W7NQ96_9BACT|nr:hypothetical protein [Breznakibacter xylanolyticus]PZX20287.1 hypothetical protein LX69_00284 [Breznakibacter xylanolyticus]
MWQFSGQLSTWGSVATEAIAPLNMGGRYIPNIHWAEVNTNHHRIDMDAAIDLHGNLTFKQLNDSKSETELKPYRLWARYSGRQYEIRGGLQKINFGSATLLRPLMWFDSMDARDPLQMTDGVWGLLGRYYFLNNANLWVWALMGNTQQRTWDMAPTRLHVPEWGGRLQHPLGQGEMALSGHHRATEALPSATIPLPAGHENRIALDGKWDVGPGLWFEGVWMGQNRPSVDDTHHLLLTVGADYTLALGNGVMVMLEHLTMTTGKQAFQNEHSEAITAASCSYPIGMGGNLHYLVYHDWHQHRQHHFINWKQQWNHWTLYLMAFTNRGTIYLPDHEGNRFAGNGGMVMVVFHH